MTDRQIQVGDVVAWEDVPRLAERVGSILLRDDRDQAYCPGGEHLVVVGKRYQWVRTRMTLGKWQVSNRADYDREAPHSWPCDDALEVSETLTIIATGLTGQETAADLQRLAEMFEVREAMLELTSDDLTADEADRDAYRLHGAGWRPGMTAEDAARMLAEAG